VPHDEHERHGTLTLVTFIPTECHMPTPADPPKPRTLRIVLIVMFAAMAVCGVVGGVVWWQFNPFVTAVPDVAESKRLLDAARGGPLTDAEFDRAVALLDAVSPLAGITTVGTLQLEAERDPARRERVIAALERVQQSGSAQMKQATGPVLARLKAPATGWVVLPVDAVAKLRGLCAVNADVVWASGTGGTVVRTADGGTTWAVTAVPGAAELDFRDVEAFGPDVAYVLAAGEGDKSRIYKTTDGGKTWQLQFTNPDSAGFFDALAFWDETHGIAVGDPVGGKFQLVHTTDGKTWQPLNADMPAALADEGAFAASGTCLITHGENGAWFVSGGPNGARAFHTTDRGKTWAVQTTPLAAGSKSAGAFGIAFRDATHGMIVGGDYTKPDESGAHAVITADGGKTWTPTAPLPFRSCVVWAGDRWVAAGTSGADATADGKAWEKLDAGNHNSVAFRDGTGWAVGPAGRVVKSK
jgi:photosystem II stability/assembly factor-like uncharacterized protein